ncbi:hypothetical protein N8627_04000 [Klebsiella pneumoniae]|nr:hypothetical protein [Klebsiella pneumoniae]UIR52068.1 hypothetical protein LZ608_04005 [Klebsiella pneumoniae subsp. pneumoniae]MBG2151308.1 hypothetical protein [Klebsiella pneumoniae]URV38381.1 hypothetical protein NB665_03965 [Klebsiella pneumoniae]URV43720.1 hypothetical protein NB666_03965 [Klebsiella pneumoniae]URV58823.1 hypothetical protein NB669_24665 [Klebsiella pneumoniae]
MFAGKKSAQIREILISESAWEEMTCLFAPSLIDGEKYKPDMFPQNTWKTSTTDKIGPDFFIYGIRMFSAGNKNLICPDSVGSFKREINGTNYDLITSSDNEDNAKKLKDMTKICVVLDSDNAQQWDTFFENNVQNKG